MYRSYTCFELCGTLSSSFHRLSKSSLNLILNYPNYCVRVILEYDDTTEVMDLFMESTYNIGAIYHETISYL